MAAPQIAIEVDPETGIWRTDSLPMVYVPRHFLVNNHRAMEEALGVEAYRRVLTPAGDRSALQWCTAEARSHGLQPEETVGHYLRRLSQRGWGRFSIEQLDAVAGTGRFSLRYSVFALEYGSAAGRSVCYMFEGFLVGAMGYLLQQAGRQGEPRCREVACAADGRHDACRFELVCVAAAA